MDVLAWRREYPGSPKRAALELVLFGVGLAALVAHNRVVGAFDETLVLAVATAAAIYALLHLLVYRGISRRWGFTLEGLGTGCVAILFCLAPMFFSGMILFIGLPIPRFTLQPGPYLAWCAFQDFAFFSLCARHAETLSQRKWVGGLIAGAAFGSSHLPFTQFAWVTFAAGTVWAWVYLKTGCIYPVLLAHWILGISLLTLR
jgi:membrane protease YdiL (CAAX protease family)